MPFLEIGLFVAGASAVLLTLLATGLILLPLLRLRGEPGSRLRTFCYFGGLGVGYIWFELVMIHRFEFYLGQPVYSASLVIAVLLIGSACGSALSARIAERLAYRSTYLVCLVLCGYALAITPLLEATLALPLTGRFIVAITTLVPAAFLMGFPFPLGLRLLNRKHAAELPWALGINGCLSVIGAVFATLVAVEIGYSALLLLAAASYLLAGLSRVVTGHERSKNRT